MPVIRAISNDFVPLAHIAAASSIQWTRKLYEVGTFEIHTMMHIEGAARLQLGAIVFLDARRVGIVDYYKADEGKRGVSIVAKGKELKDIARWRITVPGQIGDTQFYGYDRYPGLLDPDAPAESIIKHYADAHMISPEDPARKFPGLIMAPDLMRGPALRWSSRFEPLSVVYKDIGELTGMGYEVRLDLENEQFVFDVISGRDRTADSDSPVVFASEWGNVSGISYTDDASNYANTGYAGGAGEDEGRLIQTVYEDDTPRSGWDRREAWMDCGSVDMVDVLRYEGQYRLKDKARVRSITGDVIKYDGDWDIGDMATCKSRKIGVESDSLITEAKEIYEKGKAEARPVFGKRTKNFLDDIRQIGVVR